MKTRNTEWKKYNTYLSERNFQEYKRIRNAVNSMVRKDHHIYTKTILSSFKDNPKRFYGYIRNLQTVKFQVTQLEKSEEKLHLTTIRLQNCSVSQLKRFPQLKQNFVLVTQTRFYLLLHFQKLDGSCWDHS